MNTRLYWLGAADACASIGEALAVVHFAEKKAAVGYEGRQALTLGLADYHARKTISQITGEVRLPSALVERGVKKFCEAYNAKLRRLFDGASFLGVDLAG